MATTGDLATGDLVYRDSLTALTTGGAAGANKLWLPIWSGETINAYDEYNVFNSLVESRTISSGVSMEFPITGTVALKSAWQAGQELVGNTTDAASTTFAVKLDARPIAAHFEIDNIDLMNTQWEFRSELARQAGQTLANARDKQIAAYILRAAAEKQISTDPRSITQGPVFLAKEYQNLGAQIVSGSTAAERTAAALQLLKHAEDFMVYLQTINASTDGVMLAVHPRTFQDIRALGVARASTEFANNPLFGGVAESGSMGAALNYGLAKLTDSLEYMGVKIIKSNHLPLTNYSAIGEARYTLTAADCGVVALIWQKGAVASLNLQGMKVDTVNDVRRNTTFTVASMLCGTGVLRPELAAVFCGPIAANTGTDSTATKLFVTTTLAVQTPLIGANTGGSTATLARTALQSCLTMTAEYVVTS